MNDVTKTEKQNKWLDSVQEENAKLRETVKKLTAKNGMLIAHSKRIVQKEQPHKLSESAAPLFLPLF